MDYYHWIGSTGRVAREGWALRCEANRSHVLNYTVAGVSKARAGSSGTERPVHLEALLQAGEATLVLADAGARMCKARDMRETLPCVAWRLKRRWSVALGHLPGLECVLCCKQAEESLEMPDTMHLCPLCDLCMHDQCGSLLADRFSDFSDFGSLPVALDDTVIPAWWLPKLCPLCRHVQMSQTLVS